MQATLGLAILTYVITTFAGYITHLLWVFKLATGSAEVPMVKIAMMIIGVLLPPIGGLHGVYLWFA